MAALIRVEKEVSAEETQRCLSPFSLVLSILYFRYPPAACLFVLLKGECFQEPRGVCGYDYVAQAAGKPWEKCWNRRRSTWRSQFGRYALLGEKSSPDSQITRAGNFSPGPEEVSTRR